MCVLVKKVHFIYSKIALSKNKLNTTLIHNNGEQYVCQ